MTHAKEKKCVCTVQDCPRHGDCKACIEHHHFVSKRTKTTACERLKLSSQKKAE